MSHYRLYLMDKCNGHIDRDDDLDSRDDESAVDFAQALSGREPVELWCGDRNVQGFEAVATILHV